jgi:hypothetical protein
MVCETIHALRYLGVPHHEAKHAVHAAITGMALIPFALAIGWAFRNESRAVRESQRFGDQDGRNGP